MTRPGSSGAIALPPSPVSASIRFLFAFWLSLDLGGSACKVSLSGIPLSRRVVAEVMRFHIL